MEKVLLGDVLDVQRGASLSGEFYSESGNRIRLTLGNFNYPSGGFKKNTSKKDIYFTGPINPKFILKKGDLITPLTEQVAGLLGTTAFIPEDDVYIQSGDIGLVTTNENRLLKGYAYYLLNSSIIKRQLGASAQQTKIRHTSPDAIKSCVAWIPSLDQQLRITNILGTLDKKIRTNQILIDKIEALLKDIYAYWFVQFGPKAILEKGLVWNDILKKDIPRNWVFTTVGNVIDCIECGDRPSGGAVFDGIPSIGAENIISIGKYNFSACKYIPTEYYKKMKSGIVKSGDVLLYKDGAGIGNVSMVKNGFPYSDCAVNSHVFILRSKKYQTFLYLFFSQPEIKKVLVSLGLKAAQPGLNQPDVKSIKLLLPDEETIDNFNAFTEPLVDQLFIAANKNKRLSCQRDFLLPLLINGQVKVQ